MRRNVEPPPRSDDFGGQGSYAMELSHYEHVPPNVKQQIIAKAKAGKEKKED